MFVWQLLGVAVTKRKIIKYLCGFFISETLKNPIQRDYIIVL